MSRFRYFVLLTLAALAYAKRVDLVQQDRYLAHVKYLASPELQGRGAGTPGLERASVYLADEFKKFGLRPAGENGTYWQSFPVTTSAKPGKDNRLTTKGQALKINDDYTPLSFSSNGKAEAEVVFAGYGVTAPEFQYDDYQHLDVKNKVVLVLRYEPPHFRAGKPGTESPYTHHSQLVSKAINARNYGAAAVVLVNGAARVDDSTEDKLIRFGSVSGPENAGILILQAKNAVADEWLKASGKSLSELQKGIDEKRQPNSFVTSDKLRASVQVDIQRERSTVRNVVGYLPGTTSEYVIVGAHYDHLGFGNESSLAPSQIGTVHPGADDNASGTAGLLELARIAASQKTTLKRGILFIAFTGEEIGLLGSSQWVNHPTLKLEDAIAMINMDMIGRITASKLYIGGVGTGSTFDSIVKQTSGEYPFKVDFSQDGYSASDHTSFTAKSVPVLFFFSGLHGDYHKPSDTWDKIDAKDGAEVVDLVYEIMTKLATSEDRPKYAKVQPNPHAGSPGGVSSGSGYGPYFGSIPDFAPVEKGVKFSDVREGSPAAKAGLRAGDILIGFGNKPINNLYDFTYALRESKVGDVVKVKFLRDGNEMNADVTLEARK